jgi:uncharacterized membrane protein (UPF0127 family)
VKNANPVSILLRVLVLMAALSFAAGCGRGDAPQPAAATKTAADFFTVPVGGKPVRMQLAIKRGEMERGLMGRTDLKSDEGMIFIYEAPQRMSFWMRNTPTPLDIGFFSPDGTLKEVHQLYPFDETPVPSRGSDLQFALEMKQGWFEFNGVKPGAKLDLEALAKAVSSRGLSPSAYGLKAGG